MIEDVDLDLIVVGVELIGWIRLPLMVLLIIRIANEVKEVDIPPIPSRGRCTTSKVALVA